MKKKRNIIITVIVAVCMAAVVVLSYCKEAGLFVPKQLTTKEQQENPEALESLSEEEMVTYLHGGPPLNPSQESVNANGLQYTITSVEISKETNGTPSPMASGIGIGHFGGTLNTSIDQRYFGDNYMMELDGKLINDYSYLTINMQVENIDYVGITGVPDFYGGGFLLALYQENEMIFLSDIPDSYQFGEIPQGVQTDDWILQPFVKGDKLTYTICYVLKDSLLRQMSEIYLVPSPNGNIILDTSKEEWSWPSGVGSVMLRSFIDDAQLDIPEVANEPLPAPPAPEASSEPQTDKVGVETAVTQVEITKDLGDLMQGEDFYLLNAFEAEDGALDESGKLTGPYSFVAVTAQYTNGSERLDQTRFGTERVYAYRGDERAAYGVNCGVLLQDAEDVQVSEDTDSGNKIAECAFPKNAQLTVTQVFILPDAALEGSELFFADTRRSYSITYHLYNPHEQVMCWNPEIQFFALNPLLGSDGT